MKNAEAGRLRTALPTTLRQLDLVRMVPHLTSTEHFVDMLEDRRTEGRTRVADRSIFECPAYGEQHPAGFAKPVGAWRG